MRKSVRLIKRLIALFLVLLLSIESFGAVVSDNDGSAFITKAEFDSLKNDFQSQIDQYNTSIDAKIDGAIAAYLAGIKTATQTISSIILPDAANYGVISIDSKNPIEYKFGFPICTVSAIEGRSLNPASSTLKSAYVYQWALNAHENLDDNYQEKTVITNLYENGANSTAKWLGYYIDCYDYITWARQLIATYSAGNVVTDFSTITHVPEIINQKSNVELIGNAGQLFQVRVAQITGAETLNGHVMNYIATSFIMSGIRHDWGNVKYPYVTVLQNYNYDMFSNYDRDKNWAYNGSYKTSFALAKDSSKSWQNPVPDSALSSADSGYSAASTNPLSFLKFMFGDTFTHNYRYFPGDGNNNTVIESQTSPVSERGWYRNPSYRSKYVPMLGFERTYLTKWNQIYLDGTSTIAEKEVEKGVTNSILTNSNGYPYLGLTAGFPLISVEKNQYLKYNLKFKDTTKDYVVWISNKPFSSTGHPDDDTNCITLKNLDKATNTNYGYLVKNGSGTFTTETFESNCNLYIKWGIYNSTKANIGGGIFIPEKTGLLITENS